MTPTPNPTAHQIVAKALDDHAKDYWHGVLPSGFMEDQIIRELRAHGLLSEGAPSEGQQRGFRKLDQVQAILAGTQTGMTDAMRELSLAAAALTAAGVAPQAPVNRVATSPGRVKNGGDSLHVAPPSDREKLIAEATARINEWSPDAQRPSDVGMIVQLRDALAAPLDPEKVAEALGREVPGLASMRIARALCVEYTEGRLHADR